MSCDCGKGNHKLGNQACFTTTAQTHMTIVCDFSPDTSASLTSALRARLASFTYDEGRQGSRETKPKKKQSEKGNGHAEKKKRMKLLHL